MCYMDYAENYACVTAQEVQIAYFNKKQVSMLTVYVYMSLEEGVTGQSYVILSDDTRHEISGSVYASYAKLSKLLDEKFPSRKKTIMVTDGCAGESSNLLVILLFMFSAQFKNFKMFSNIAKHQDDFGGPLCWVFSASGHGKSVCDGIGMIYHLSN